MARVFMLTVIMLPSLLFGQSFDFPEHPFMTDGLMPGLHCIFTMQDEECPTQYYDDGLLLASGDVKAGLAHGRWELYNQTGKVVAKGNMDMGYADGEWTFYHPNGQIWCVGEYKRMPFELGCVGSENYADGSGRIGTWVFYSPTGILLAQRSYHKGICHGRYKTWYQDGTPSLEGQYHEGLQNGIWTYYHPNGQRARQEYYKWLGEACENESDEPDDPWFGCECKVGNWTSWQANGRVESLERYDGQGRKLESDPSKQTP